MSMNQNTPESRRARWLGILAQSSPRALDEAWQRVAHKPSYQFLRRPEVGMVLVQGRIGNSGRRFNFGEITVTRCAIQTDDGPRAMAMWPAEKPKPPSASRCWTPCCRTRPGMRIWTPP